MTGAVFNAAKRIQLNFQLKEDSHIRWASHQILRGVGCSVLSLMMAME